MTKRKTYEELEEGRARRQSKQEDRFLEKLDRKMKEAEALVGHLNGAAGFRYYINVRSKDGKLTGGTRKFTTEGAAIDYLIRNHYV